MEKPKILFFDIETAPITAYVWGLFDQNVGLNQIKKDWHLIAWAAKWAESKEVIYADNRFKADVSDDTMLLTGLIALINEADIVVTQNGEAFDLKKLRARAVMNGLQPIKPVKSTDIYREGKKVFAFTSHKLEYISSVLNKKYKKLKHEEYPGFELWKAVLAGDKKAWAVMERYTKHDVLATEEAYNTIHGWIKTQSMASYVDDVKLRCACGSQNLEHRGYVFSENGKYQRFRCKTCGKWPRGKVNLLSKNKRASMLGGGDVR